MRRALTCSSPALTTLKSMLNAFQNSCGIDHTAAHHAAVVGEGAGAVEGPAGAAGVAALILLCPARDARALVAVSDITIPKDAGILENPDLSRIEACRGRRFLKRCECVRSPTQMERSLRSISGSLGSFRGPQPEEMRVSTRRQVTTRSSADKQYLELINSFFKTGLRLELVPSFFHAIACARSPSFSSKAVPS